MIQSNSIMPQDAPEVKAAPQPFKFAHRYAELGYPVFPCAAGKKEPACSRGVHDATTDSNTIHQWLRQNPGYNIGMSADDVLVLDVDIRLPDNATADDKAAAQEELVGLVRELFGTDAIPSGVPVTRTPNGGFHIYLRCGRDWAAEWQVGNSKILLGDKYKFIREIDLKGCGRGYTLLPPSQVDGVQYRFVAGTTWLPSREELPMMPDQVRSALEKLISAARPKRNGNSNGTPTTVAPTIQQVLDNADASELVDELLTVWQPGRRQDLALAVAGVLRRAGYSETFALEVIERLVTLTADPEETKRRDAVRSTYSKPIDQIAGWSLLLPEERAALAAGMARMAPFHSVRGLPYEQKSILRAVAAQMGLTDARYNVIQHRIEGQTRDGSWRALNDGDISAFAFIFIEYVTDDGKQHRIKPGKERVYDAVCAYAYKNEYNPIAHLLLEELPGWDGQDRIALLARHLKHSMPRLANGADPVEVFLKKWLVGAVSRALNSSQNIVLILVGAQGIGKSSFVQWLAPNPELFSSAPLDPDSRESVVLAGKVLVHELAELGSVTRRKDVDSLKRFLSADATSVRLPYARTDTIIRHRSSYVATANQAADLLRDSTGNRRFVALQINDIDWGYTVIDKLQLWAQAVALFRSGFDFTLTPDEQSYQAVANSQHEAIRQSFAAEALLSIAETVKYHHQQSPLSTVWGETQLAPDSEQRIPFAASPDGVFVSTADFAVAAAERFRVPAERVAEELRRLVARVGGETSARRRRGVARVRGCELTWEQLEALLQYICGAEDEPAH
jgi:hypothetical protein